MYLSCHTYFQTAFYFPRAEFPEDLHNKFEIVQFSFCPLQLGGGLIFPTAVGRRRIELFRSYCASLLGTGL